MNSEQFLKTHAQNLPEDYNGDVPEMDGEEDPRNRHQRRADAARARKEKARKAKIQAKIQAKRRKKRRKK